MDVSLALEALRGTPTMSYNCLPQAPFGAWSPGMLLLLMPFPKRPSHSVSQHIAIEQAGIVAVSFSSAQKKGRPG